jgi:hypothetical protein
MSMSQLHTARSMGPGKSRLNIRGLTPPARHIRGLTPPARLLTPPARGIRGLMPPARRRRQRGVILLVALGVLLVFALAVVMFVISARQHKATSRAYQRQERYDVNFESQLESAAMVFLRDTNNKSCSIIDHGLLHNLYGNDSLPPPRDAMNIPNPDNPNEDPDSVVLTGAGDIVGDFNGDGTPDGKSGLVLLTVQDVRLSQLNGFYNGRVLTVLRTVDDPNTPANEAAFVSPVRMQSTRIVGYNWSNGVGTFQVLAFENGQLPHPNPQSPPNARDSILINGREFNGHGFGYNPASGGTNAMDPTYNQPLALLPNHAGLAIDTALGGTDVSYNVPDHNNMHMAARVWIPDDPSLNAVLHSSLRGGRWVVIAPSFHRPDLANYYAKNPLTAALAADPTAGNIAAAAFHKRYILRPLRNMHPPLPTPTRPGFNYETDAETLAYINPDSDNNGLLDMLQATVNGQLNSRGLIWDVDNDGDGLVDSIWVDLGMPVQTAPDGRQYKPLFAILCLDMDSRFNLSAHGTAANVLLDGPQTLTPGTPIIGPRPYADYNMTATPNATLGPGQGNSPATVNPRVLFDQAQWQRFLVGVSGSGTEKPKNGRHGEWGQNNIMPGLSDGQRDAEDFVNHPQYPFGYGVRLVGTSPTGFDVPIDFGEKSFLALGKAGDPLRLLMGLQPDNATPPPTFTPFEIQHPLQANVYRERYAAVGGGKVAIDSPITVAEHEALQRRYDVDFQSLDQRLRRLLPELWDESTPFARLRQGLVTALGHDLPVFSPMVTPEIRAEMLARNIQPTGNHLIDLIAYKILSDTRLYPNTAPLAPPSPPATAADMSRAIELLLAPELARGERMNVNRPFGNGRDEHVNPTDAGFGVVDEPRNNLNDPTGPTEVGNEAVWWANGQIQTSGVVYGPPLPPQHQNFNNVAFDANNDGVLDIANVSAERNDLQARQLMARNLYMLMMLVVDREYVIPTGEANIDKKRYLAQRIAQWAVNVVDYLDPDSISTPFEFDYDPFVDNDGVASNGTWDVDGWIGVRPDGTPSSDDNKVPPQPRKDAFRGLVWGCERPQLLLKSGIAFHDIRTDDLDTEDPDPAGDKAAKIGDLVTPDPDFDQPRRPQGTLIAEIFNPSLEPVPFEFRCKRNVAGLLNANAVDLSRLAPASNDPSLTDPKQRFPRPIWQLAIRLGDAEVRTKPDTGHLDPTFPDTNKQADNVARIVWFVADSQYGFDPYPGGNPGVDANADGIPDDTISQKIDSRIYHTLLRTWNAGTPDASREDYDGWENKVGFDSDPDNQARMCLVGPGRYAVIGPRVRTRIGGSSPGGGNGQNITIRLLDDTASTPMPPRDIPANTNAAGRLVSDTPAVNYPNWGARPGVQQIQTPTGIVINYPRSLSISEPSPTSYYKTPDGLSSYADEPTVQYRDTYSKPLDIPLDPPNMRSIGWRPRFATVYLQRLANPLEAWHPQRNPYLTVDYMPIDLNTFNGVYTGADNDPPVQALQAPNDPNPHFTTRERIGENDDWNVWKQSFSTPEARAPRDFAHSFGFLSGFGNGGAVGNRYFAADGVWTSTEFPAPSPYIGVPKKTPYPWFTWNDHPFVSHLELMNVPASSPSRLLLEHRLRRNDGKQFYNHYVDRDPAGDELGPQTPGPPYGHLLNFCLSSDVLTDDPPANGWNVQNAARSNFFRVFDVLRVPSRFNGADQILNPQAFMAQRLSFNNTPIPHAFHPPFNRISAYRDPGRININTLFDDGTMWRAIMNNDTPGRTMQHWRTVFYSRQGYGNPTSGQALLPMLDANSPTMFANPFRPFSEGYNVPVPALRNQPTGAAFAANPNPAGPARDLVEATLLRPDPLDPSRPLLVPESAVDNIVAGAAGIGGAGNATAAYNDADRNPYFRYQGLTKLGNLITTRSNVYSVWITVGYFEVVPDSTLPRSQYPDGYTLGPELGSDTGEVTRHRMFFVVDRTIPVAFQRGEDFNVQKAILLKKIIE